MTNGIIGTAIVLVVAVISWLTGIIMGTMAGKKATAKWLDEKGCFMCQEKYKNPMEWF